MVSDLTHFERAVGRYLVYGEIGAGGMAAVHLGRFVGPAGFTRIVAIKRMHPNLAKDREFVNAFLDEARIAARIAHPNVASIDDVVIDENEVLLVMDYVHGAALSQLWEAACARHDAVPIGIAVAIAVDLLHGLHAAHSARDERARPLRLVHRDVSPQNVLVGVDGVARVLDFGIAKALGRLHTTTNGAVKGKLAYMAPERFLEEEVTASVDQYAAAIVLWELLAGERYFGTSSSPVILPKVVAAEYRHLDDPKLGAVDAVLQRALQRTASDRFPDCSAFATALEGAADSASRLEIGAWVQKLAGGAIEQKARAIETIERASVPSMPAASPAVDARSEPAPPSFEEPTRLEDTKLSAQGAQDTNDPLITGTAAATSPAPAKRAVAPLVVGAVLAVAAGGVVTWRLAAPRPEVAPAAAASTSAPAPDAAVVAPPVVAQAAPESTTPPAASSVSSRPSPAGHASVKHHVRAGADAGVAPAVPSGRSSLDAPTDRK